MTDRIKFFGHEFEVNFKTEVVTFQHGIKSPCDITELAVGEIEDVSIVKNGKKRHIDHWNLKHITESMIADELALKNGFVTC